MSGDDPKLSDKSKQGIPESVQAQVAALCVDSIQAQSFQPGETERRAGEVEYKGQTVAAYAVPGTNAIFTDGEYVLLGSRESENPTKRA